MQVSLETQEGLKRKITVTVPDEEIQKAYNKKIDGAMKSVKIDGFRPGKTPRKVVEERYGESVRRDIVNEVLQRTLFEAITEQKLNPAGSPVIESLAADEGKDLEYVASFEVYPEIELKDLSGLEIEKVASEIQATDLENLVEQLRKQRTEWNEVEREAKKDDQVIIDFDGSVDGEPVEGGKAEKVPLVLGSNSMIPGFEDGIIGAKAGDDLEVNVKFPDGYHEAKLSGKPAVFKIKVHKVNEAKLPEVNDEFLKQFGVKEGGIEKFKEDLKKHMTKELEAAVKVKNKNAVLEKLLEINKVEIPNALLEAEIEALHQQMHQQQGQAPEKDHKLTDEERKHLEEPAKRRITLGLLIGEFIKKNELKPDADRVKTLIESMSSSYENPAEFVKWYYGDKQRLGQIEAVAMEDQAVEKLLETAKIVDKKMDYKDVMQAQGQ
jgi:trigger factor